MSAQNTVYASTHKESKGCEMICINWTGFPPYGARCVRALVNAMPEERCMVVGYRPVVPVEGMEKICGCPVVWVEEHDKRSIKEICGEIPRFMTISGWFSPLYNRWRDEVRGRLFNL